jgi:hypothetical protein
MHVGGLLFTLHNHFHPFLFHYQLSVYSPSSLILTSTMKLKPLHTTILALSVREVYASLPYSVPGLGM